MANEILQINKSILRESGVSVTAYMFMLILMYYPNTKININLTQILEYGFIIENDVGYSLTDIGLEFIGNMESQNVVVKQSKKASVELVNTLREMYPEGKKTGTNQYWRDNVSNITKKLNQFYKDFGYFEDEKIIEATQKYLASFNGNNQLMRVLKYFILKNDESELMTILDNLEDVKDNSNDDLWTTKLT